MPIWIPGSGGGTGSSTLLEIPIAGGSSVPSPLIANETPISLNPVIYYQDAGSSWHAASGVDTTSTDAHRTTGTVAWFQKYYFRDTGASTQGGKNALVSINHLINGATEYDIQDRGLWISSTNISASIASFSITTNVVSVVVSGVLSGGGTGTTFRPGMRVRCSGLAVGTYLNAVDLFISTVTNNGGGNYTITAPFTHADVTSTGDTGKLDQAFYSMTCSQMEMDIVGTPTATGSPDGEMSCLSLQVSSGLVSNVGRPQTYGANVIRAQYYREASSTGDFTSGEPTANIRSIFTDLSANSSPVGTIHRNIFVKASNAGNTNLAYYAVHVQAVSGGRFGGGNIGLLVDDFGSNAADYAIQTLGTGQCSFNGNVIVGGTLSVSTWPTTTAKTFLGGPTSGGAAPATFRILANTDIPAFTGDAGAGGTTGGVPAPAAGDAAAGKFLKADGTWAVIGAAGSVNWNSINSATGNMSVNNAAFTTSFNQTSAVNWLWANTTAATASTVASSPILQLQGTIFTAGASAADTWSIQNVETAVSFAISNIIETAGNVVTLTTAANTFGAGQTVTLTGLTTGTWLNGQTVVITSTSATTIVFTDPTAHGLQATHAETGTVTLVAVSKLSFTHSGAPGAMLVLPTGSGGSGGYTGINGTAMGWGGIGTVDGDCFGYIGGGTWAFQHVNSNSSSLQFYGASTLVGLIQWSNNTSPTGLQILGQTANQPVMIAGNFTTGTTTAVVYIGSRNNMAGISGVQNILNIGSASNAGTVTFNPASGTAAFQVAKISATVNQTGTASGSYTGLLVSMIETALLGTTNRLLDLQAGTLGTTTQFAVSNTGKVTVYNGVATAGLGQPAEFAQTVSTAQVANLNAGAALTLLTAPATGLYRVVIYSIITQAATTSSTLPSNTIGWTDPTSSVAQTFAASATSTANNTTTHVQNEITVYAKTGTAITLTQAGYTSVGATAMQFTIAATVEAL